MKINFHALYLTFHQLNKNLLERLRNNPSYADVDEDKIYEKFLKCIPIEVDEHKNVLAVKDIFLKGGAKTITFSKEQVREYKFLMKIN